MRDILDLDRYPNDQPERLAPLIERCQAELAANGMFNLDGLVRAEAIEKAAAEVAPMAGTDS